MTEIFAIGGNFRSGSAFLGGGREYLYSIAKEGIPRYKSLPLGTGYICFGGRIFRFL